MLADVMNQVFELYEKPGADEKNTYNVDITEDMTTKDVMEKVLEILDGNCK